MSSVDSGSLPSSVGFIGLGIMGKPMVLNLARKLPPGSHIHLHDVAAAVVEDLLVSLPEVMVKSGSAKEVAEKSVCGNSSNGFIQTD